MRQNLSQKRATSVQFFVDDSQNRIWPVFNKLNALSNKVDASLQKLLIRNQKSDAEDNIDDTDKHDPYVNAMFRMWHKNLGKRAFKYIQQT